MNVKRWVRCWVLVVLAVVSGAVLASESGGEDAKGSSEYIPLTPPFVTNFGGPGGIHYLKADIVLRVTGGPEAQNKVIHHIPYIRDVLIMLLNDQTEDSLATMQGKEKLRKDALDAVNKVMVEEEGKPLVEDLLFNSFVVQR